MMRAALAAIAIALPSSAALASTLQASLSNFTITVTDLDPTDGIQSALLVSQVQTSLTTDALRRPGFGDLIVNTFDGWNGPLQTSSRDGVVGQAAADESSLFAWGSTSPGRAWAFGSAEHGAWFSLTPHTAVRLQGDMSISMDMSDSCSPTCDLGQAFVGLNVSQEVDSTMVPVVETTLGYRSYFEGAVGARTRHFDLSFESGSSYWWSELGMASQVQTFLPPPVPEPASAALFAVGLTLLGGVASRRGARGG